MNRPHRQLHGERGEESKPRPGLQRTRKGMVHEGRNVGGAGIPIERHDRKQHQHRAEEGVEKELEARIDPARAAPHTDDEEHRDQAAFEEQVEQGQIKRRKGADHQGLQHQKRDHVLLDAPLDRLPAREDAQRHQRRGEDHERQGDAIDPDVVADGAGEPRLPFDELELRGAGVEAPHQDQRDREGDQRRPHRHPTGVAGDGRVLAAHRHDEQRAEQRQEHGDGKDRPAHHLSVPRPQT